MRLALNEDHRQLADAVRDVLENECSPQVIRAAWATPGSRVPAEPVLHVWRVLADLGVPGLLVPERLGGLGLDDIYLVALMEEFGRVAPPLPVLETICAAPVIAEARAEYAERLVSGDIRVAWAPDRQRLVPWGAQASLILLGGSPASRQLALLDEPLAPDGTVAVDRARPVVRCPRHVEQRAATLAVSSVKVDQLWLRGVLGSAAQLIGLARRMIEMTVGYVSGRTQFGVPVGSFQAVKHALADAHIAVEFARPAVLAAAWSLMHEEDPSLVARDVSMAKVLSGRAAIRTARTAIQCHGGVGYTTEYDLHLFAKRAWALDASFGTARYHRDLVARAIGLTPEDHVSSADSTVEIR
jgi:alkylation response protein AidB-like acyl-CoA dehydrogenase